MRLKYCVIERFRGIYPIEAMCEVFEVSRSGYYAWRRAQKKMPRDQWLIDLIVQCQQQCNQTYGIRRVRRWIQRQKGKTVNLKALLRVMRKTNLLAQIRRRRTYTQLKQSVYKYPNLLQRAFEQCQPNRFWVTDITYIPTPQGHAVPVCSPGFLRAYGIGLPHWQQYGGIAGHTDDPGCSDYRKGHWWTRPPQ